MILLENQFNFRLFYLPIFWKFYMFAESLTSHFSFLLQNSTQTIGHFTTMVQDKGDKIGCAAVFYEKSKSFVVCNYAFNNVRGFKVYSRAFDSSRVASGCVSGQNPKYPALCSENEVVENKPSSNDDDPFVPEATTTKSTAPTTTTPRSISVDDLFNYDISNWFNNYFGWW